MNNQNQKDPDEDNSLSKTTNSPEPTDGNWLDESWMCKICGGEIPHGHKSNCDIYKLEYKLKQYEKLVQHVLGWAEANKTNFEIEAEAISEAVKLLKEL